MKTETYQKELEKLLPRSFEMYDFMADHISKLEPYPTLKHQLAFQSGMLCFEHGLAMWRLINEGLMSSGFGLMRLQYESLVRGFWMMYAENNAWFSKLTAAGKIGPSELKKLETPMLADMLKSLDNTQAPQHILAQLNDFRALNNTPFNSFTHGGVLALLTNGVGFEPKLIYDSIRNANAVAAINLQMMSILTEVPEAIEPIRGMHYKFVDCLPIIHA